MNIESFLHQTPQDFSEDPENQIDDLLQQVPYELRVAWQTLIWEGTSSPDDALCKLKALLIQRSNALKPAPKSSIEMSVNEHHLSPEQREGMRKEALEIARKIIERTNNVIGEGGTATVHSSEQYPDTCYKYIFDAESNDDYLDFNDIFEELHIMDTVFPINVDGVRCPKPRFAFAEGGVTVLVMEELPAISLRKILAGVGQLPENFDVNTFLDRLSAYLELLHTKCSTYHRDLHDENILVGSDGTPYVIDFGRSARGVLGTEDPYERHDRTTGDLVGRYNDDLLQLELHRKELWKHVRNKVKN